MTLEQWRSHGQFFEFDSYRIFYLTAGRGEPLVLLHAYPTASWGFHKIWEPLAEQFHVITLDLLGSGFSDKPPGPHYSVFYLADIVEALLAQLNITRFHLLCHAYGGTTGQELLARCGDRHSAPSDFGSNPVPQMLTACFINSGLFPEGTKPTLTQKLLLTPVGASIVRLTPYPYRVFCRKLARNFGPHTQPSAAELDDFWTLLTLQDGHRIVPDVLSYLKERGQHRDRWVGALQAAQLPLCLISGAADPVSGELIPKIWQALLPDADLIELDPTIGHYPPLEDPEGVLTAYRTFLEKNGCSVAIPTEL